VLVNVFTLFIYFAEVRELRGNGMEWNGMEWNGWRWVFIYFTEVRESIVVPLDQRAA
jgi:hypothetical protein